MLGHRARHSTHGRGFSQVTDGAGAIVFWSLMGYTENKDLVLSAATSLQYQLCTSRGAFVRVQGWPSLAASANHSIAAWLQNGAEPDNGHICPGRM